MRIYVLVILEEIESVQVFTHRSLHKTEDSAIRAAEVLKLKTHEYYVDLMEVEG